MKVHTPGGVHLQRLITVHDLEQYGASTDRERLEVRAYLRFVVRESSPGNARATIPVVAGFFAVTVTVLVFISGRIEGDPQVLVDSVLRLGIVALILLSLGGATLGFAWREDRRNAIATAWLAEIEAAEARLGRPGEAATQLPPGESRQRRRRSVPARSSP